MNIHIIGSLREFNKDIIYLQTIADVVETNSHLIGLNWFAAVKDMMQRDTHIEEMLNWQEIVTNNLDATVHADALIVEGSRFNYSQGYQTAVALQHGKPVLNLYRENLPDYIEKPDKFFVSGIHNPLFQSKSYKDEDDLKKIVTKFLKDITPRTVDLDLRLSLDPNTSTYLDILMAKTGKSKNSLIKDIITKKAKEGDASS